MCLPNKHMCCTICTKPSRLWLWLSTKSYMPIYLSVRSCQVCLWLSINSNLCLTLGAWSITLYLYLSINNITMLISILIATINMYLWMRTIDMYIGYDPKSQDLCLLMLDNMPSWLITESKYLHMQHNLLNNMRFTINFGCKQMSMLMSSYDLYSAPIYRQ